MKQVDVDINVTAHKEGYYLYRTLRSIERMRTCAQARDIKTRVRINLDNANELTIKIAEKHALDNPDIEIYQNHFGDLSESRNFLISKSNSKYILFVDGDDLFTENFLAEACEAAEKYQAPCVVSAEDIVKFSDRIDPVIFRAESTLEQPGIKSAIFEINLFVSQNLVSTEIYKNIIYEQNKGNYGFEDWHWNTKVIDAGYEYLVARGTAFFYRQKPDEQSLLRQNINANTVLRETALFSPKKYVTLPHEFYRPKTQTEEVRIEPKENPAKIFVRELALQSNLQDTIAYRGVRKLYRKSRKRPVEQSSSDEAHKAEALPHYPLDEPKKNQWRKMNAIEPLIRLSHDVEAGLLLYKYKKQHNLASTYYEFCKVYGEANFTDVIFVPWINSGGADLAMLRLCRVLVKNNRKVLMLTTNGLPSQWESRVREIDGVTLIQSHDDIFKNLDHVNIKLLFLRIVQNWHIKTMTVMNSSIGFELIDRYGNAIKDTGCKTIVHSYAMPTEDEWTIDAFPSYGASLERVDLTITDSVTYKEQLQHLYGLEEFKVVPLMLPISTEVKPKQTSEPKFRILFANRLAREKQPDIAIQTLNLLKENGIIMDMYGAKDTRYLERIHFDSLLNEAENVEYKGMFNGIGSIDFNNYDICFMPSLYEGTPNIVLEAAKGNLYILGTKTGGMPEVVNSKYIGHLLETAATPHDFAERILDYYADAKLQSIKKRKMANKQTLDAHSRPTYEADVLKLYEVET